MTALGLSLVLLLTGAHISSIAAGPGGPSTSPHAEAIRLVMLNRADEIRSLDKDPDWWHDTKERVWSVRRPFGPGTLDTTHFFSVTYAIEGEVVGSWSVNTETGQVAGPGESVGIGAAGPNNSFKVTPDGAPQLNR